MCLSIRLLQGSRVPESLPPNSLTFSIYAAFLNIAFFQTLCNPVILWLDYIRIFGYSSSMRNISNIFKSLGDETRLRLLALLLEEEELCVCYLVDVLQLPQSTVSRHLSLLKRAGWLKDRREGVWIYYSICRSPAPVQQFLLPVLRNFLNTTDIAREDQKRLQGIMQGDGFK
jgi:ArsR family transcriptional regulator, arsenate/arsenite/antimonite-responsive transcriptional repressor